MSLSSSNIQTKILFDSDESGSVGAMSSATLLSAPTVFTGQRLRGALLVSGAQEPPFDTVQILFKGIHIQVPMLEFLWADENA